MQSVLSKSSEEQTNSPSPNDKRKCGENIPSTLVESLMVFILFALIMEDTIRFALNAADAEKDPRLYKQVIMFAGFLFMNFVGMVAFLADSYKLWLMFSIRLLFAVTTKSISALHLSRHLGATVCEPYSFSSPLKLFCLANSGFFKNLSLLFMFLLISSIILIPILYVKFLIYFKSGRSGSDKEETLKQNIAEFLLYYSLKYSGNEPQNSISSYARAFVALMLFSFLFEDITGCISNLVNTERDFRLFSQVFYYASLILVDFIGLLAHDSVNPSYYPMLLFSIRLIYGILTRSLFSLDLAHRFDGTICTNYTFFPVVHDSCSNHPGFFKVVSVVWILFIVVTNTLLPIIYVKVLIYIKRERELKERAKADYKIIKNALNHKVE